MPAPAAAPKPKGFKTFVAKPGEIQQKWYVIDASDRVLGRMAQRIAVKLMGKDKPTYTPHLDTGDFVVVINAEKVYIDPRKRTDKMYQHWSGYLGGLKRYNFEELQAKHPDEIIRRAVRLMLPKNLLADKMLGKLKLYKGPDHPHAAQKPEAWDPAEAKRR